MSLRWRVTAHAARRYQLRVDPRVSAARATQLLEQAGTMAERLNEDTLDGASQYLCAELGCVAICREPPETGEERVVVSVIAEARIRLRVVEAFGPIPVRPIVPHLDADEPAWAALRREVRTLLADYVLRAGLIRLPRVATRDDCA